MDAEHFIDLVTEITGAPNGEQARAIVANTDVPLLVLAGPGSGKTRVLVLRALRHVLVDQMLPETVIITTFTRKAAKEIRSRLISWGMPLVERAREACMGDAAMTSFLERVDINRFVTGTLDALCEEALDASRAPADRRLTVIDPYGAKSLLARAGEARSAMNADPSIAVFLSGFMLDGREPFAGSADALSQLQTISDRLVNDCIDRASIEPARLPGLGGVLEIVDRYEARLEADGLLDFARMERIVLDRLEAERDLGALTAAQAILVDEYQDTNPLQERIYFAMAKRSGAALTVVGDDDQSLYRFRGATIELFRNFDARARQALDIPRTDRVELRRNYRSSPDIVDYFNRYIVNDPNFSPAARVQPLKPVITAEGNRDPFPVLGIFRDGPEAVATAAAEFLQAVFSRHGYTLPDGTVLRGHDTHGAYGDAVLLAKSVNEFARPFGSNPPTARFTHHLRGALEAQGVRVYNPRGRAVRDVPAVAQLMGLIVEAIDPTPVGGGQPSVQANLYLSPDALRTLDAWRAAASALLDADPQALNGHTLSQRMREMRNLARPMARGSRGPRDWPVLDAVYAFVPYIAAFSDDPEHQVYLEVISRTAAQMATFSAYRGLVVRDEDHLDRSLGGVYYDLIRPLATGEADVDEDILPDVPRNVFPMMTIHQAKGLEFPLVMVDVASDFKSDHPKNRFKRFPVEPSGTARLEDALADYTEIGPLRTARSGLDRTFEDLIREHYVAFSRPEAVLVLLGNEKTLSTKSTIKHVGLDRRQDGSWAWTDGYPARKPPSHAQVPFIRI